MQIQEIIDTIKHYHSGIYHGQPIDESTTRDKILYGQPHQECTGIITTCFASIQVIQQAIKRNCNLIIVHEALFWNHGDHTEWLADNSVFQKKEALLKQHQIVVWRDHDYIHSGIPMGIKMYTDGIFYGFMKQAEWDAYLISPKSSPMVYDLQGQDATQVAKHLIQKFHLNGTRIIGDPHTKLHKIAIVLHILGYQDNAIIQEIEQQGYDGIITLEMTDYTVQEYMRDRAYSGHSCAIIALGHFNVEEPGMRYMAEVWLPKIIHDLPIYFIQSGDQFQYIVGE